MAKIKTLKPLISTMKPRLGYTSGNKRERSQYRDRTQVWRSWYKSSRWQKLIWSILVRDLFTCAMCGKIESNTSQLVCDHVERHHGDEQAFWSGPFQTLCKQRHDRDKQRMEQVSLHMRGCWD